MKISLSTVTDSRFFSKAFFRLKPNLDLIRDCAHDLKFDNEGLEVIQIVFTEDPSSTISAPKNGESIIQIETAIPAGDYRPNSDDELFANILSNVKEVVASLSLDDMNRLELNKRLNSIG